jgi:N-acetyl-gamma-glutamyl-phosphate reductase
MVSVFIDGQAGTTGLKLAERLSRRADVRLLAIPDASRKDAKARASLMNEADAVFLCLPDDAAIEAARLVTNPRVVTLDASTAHRTDAGWVYGFPELDADQRARIKTAKRIAVPGCYATGFVALVAPLVKYGLLGNDAPLCCHALSGYSGGGNKMISEYESADRPAAFDSPRQYGLPQNHKHLPEMVRFAGLAAAPVFNPIVCDYFAGMVVSVPLHGSIQRESCGVERIRDIYRKHYDGSIFVRVEDNPADGFLAANTLAGADDLVIRVAGNDERATLTAAFDNLGKGASGAAMQCMNLVLGLDEAAGFGADLGK